MTASLLPTLALVSEFWRWAIIISWLANMTLSPVVMGNVDLSPEVTGNMFDPGGVMGASMVLVDVRLDPGGVTVPPPTW